METRDSQMANNVLASWRNFSKRRLGYKAKYRGPPTREIWAETLGRAKGVTILTNAAIFRSQIWPQRRFCISRKDKYEEIQMTGHGNAIMRDGKVNSPSSTPPGHAHRRLPPRNRL